MSERLPNMRLKLPAPGKNCVPSPASLVFCPSTALRQPAFRPQLKRDSLGSAGGDTL